MKASVLSLDGVKVGEIELSKAFGSAVDAGLIKRAVLSIRSMAVQPKGTFPLAGRANTAMYRGRRRR